MVRNTGVLPIGFNMAKKPMNTVDKNRVRFGIEFIGSKLGLLSNKKTQPASADGFSILSE
jgi:hypothetical protein